MTTGESAVSSELHVYQAPEGVKVILQLGVDDLERILNGESARILPALVVGLPGDVSPIVDVTVLSRGASSR